MSVYSGIPTGSFCRRSYCQVHCKALHCLIILAIVCTVSPAFAWGTKGHEWINENAITLLPDGPLKTALAGQAGKVAFYGVIPDFQWKDGNIGKLEAPEHYIDLEILAPAPKASDVPRTRLEAGRLYTARGVPFSAGGFLPWRVEDMYCALVNAMKAEPANVAFFAGVLGHYVGDCTQPLHTTVNFDGRVGANGRKELAGIHADYEITYLEDQGLEFRKSSLALAAKPAAVKDVHDATCALILDSFSKVDTIYDVARRDQGADKYAAWDRDMGAMTRGQLAKAATLLSSLWLTAWEEAGRPELKVGKGS